jgi:hypothetical protein
LVEGTISRDRVLGLLVWPKLPEAFWATFPFNQILEILKKWRHPQQIYDRGGYEISVK